MEDKMKTMTKKTAVVALAGVMAAGMLTGCGEKALDGTKTVATVDGTEIPLGMLSLSVREGQAQAEAMYKSFMGGSDYSIWGTEAEEGKTYGEQAVEQALEDIELMCILKEKAADYDVEITEDDEKAIADAAAAFMSANTEDTLKTLAVTEDQVKTYLELETYKSRMHDPIIADVDKNVSDEEAQQSSFNYVSISTSDLSDDEIKQKKEDAQKILDGLNADPDGDFGEIAKSVDDSYTVLSGSFDTNEDASEEESDDEDETTASSSNYPDEVMKVLRTLKDGEVGPDVIEADSAYYVVKLDKVNDEDATATKKESIISTRENELYTETTDKWLDEADIKVEKKVLKTLKVTDNHKFTIQTAAEVTETPEVTEAADATETPEVTEAADATATPEVTEAPSYDTDSSLEVKDGDTVNIDYVGKIDDVAFDGGSTDGNGTDLVIGSGSYIDNFEEQLIGAHPGDKVEVKVTFPDDYQATDLAGKEAVFDVTVNGIYE
jgi:foldase protein PrsA